MIERVFIQEGKIMSEIENFLRKELEGAGYSSVKIQKTPLATRITLYVERPPLVIGKKGERIAELTEILKERFGVENPSIDVQRVENPILDPQIVAHTIARALAKGVSRKRIAYRMMNAIMNAGARGVEILIAGKIVGKGGKAKKERYSAGYMRKAGDSVKLVREGKNQALLKAGVIGVTVRIIPPDTKFPDELEVVETSNLSGGEKERLADAKSGSAKGTE